MSTAQEKAAEEKARAEKERGAKLAREGIDALGNVVDTAKEGVDAVTGAASDAADEVDEQGVTGAAEKAGEGLGKRIKKAVKGTNWGGMIGGLLGVIAAWFMSTMFGGGMFGTIAFMLLAIPAFLMGNGFGRRNMNGLFGGENEAPARDNAQRGVQMARETGGPAAEQPAAQASQTNTGPEIRTMTPTTADVQLAQAGLNQAARDSIQQTQQIYARSGAQLNPGDFGLADATITPPIVPGQQAAVVRGT